MHCRAGVDHPVLLVVVLGLHGRLVGHQCHLLPVEGLVAARLRLALPAVLLQVSFPATGVARAVLPHLAKAAFAVTAAVPLVARPVQVTIPGSGGLVEADVGLLLLLAFSQGGTFLHQQQLGHHVLDGGQLLCSLDDSLDHVILVWQPRQDCQCQVVIIDLGACCLELVADLTGARHVLADRLLGPLVQRGQVPLELEHVGSTRLPVEVLQCRPDLLGVCTLLDCQKQVVLNAHHNQPHRFGAVGVCFPSECRLVALGLQHAFHAWSPGAVVVVSQLVEAKLRHVCHQNLLFDGCRVALRAPLVDEGDQSALKPSASLCCPCLPLSHCWRLARGLAPN